MPGARLSSEQQPEAILYLGMSWLLLFISLHLQL